MPLVYDTNTMTTRRAPLSSNPNAANSPLRTSHALLKHKTYTKTIDPNPQPPPAKKQALNNGSSRPLSYREAYISHDRRHASTYEAKIARERSARHNDNHAVSKISEKEVENLRAWQAHHRTKFPKFVFYFEKVPESERYKCSKQLASLGAREDQFFSIDITHVITTRAIPPEKARDTNRASDLTSQADQEQPQTINPSLLNRSRNILFESATGRRAQVTSQEDAARRPRARNNDILHLARDMGKKIWSLEKFQRMLDILTDQDPALSKSGSYYGSHGASKASEPNLLQMLQNERVNGPSDRDPTVSAKELHMFAGPYILVYDVNEKQKPIMAREYAKVSQKTDGDWPQFRSVAGGRCPFVDDSESREITAERERPKPKTEKLVRPSIKPVTGKRTLAEMEDGQNRGTVRVLFGPPKKVESKPVADFRQNAFTSRAGAPRLLAGEPIASGLQKSGATSAIRSQMMSSTAGGLNPKAGTSKEMQGLQRTVLQRHSTNASLGEPSAQDTTSSRSTSQLRTGQPKFDMIEVPVRREKRTKSQAIAKPKKRDPKPGYCENCQDKFDDFEEHIASRKHRKFAENDNNWTQLDDLLAQLERPMKPRSFSYGYTYDSDL